ncbi:DNA-cytosine methyltransferase [hydrothermal vent metagenome]|uniref:DNA (cytosine-5-)-methyltransferase n=1 Tax=hydrothermal vent metagenome TaxID=652676 RepID=A0A3B1BTR5_9ZZZZ
MNKKNKTGVYIDLFSGCGGFSLGLGNAGWDGLFAVEKDPMAFETFKHNLIDGRYGHFSWPTWLPQQSTTIQTLLKSYPDKLKKLRGKVDLIAGGPPCQGFSMAGQRNSADPRNKLSQQYIKMVELVRPKYLVLENVRGFNVIFKDKNSRVSKQPYAMIVKEKLEALGYKIYHDYVHTENYGVPQRRTRFLMIGIHSQVLKNNVKNPFEVLGKIKDSFLEQKGLSNRPVTVSEAIGDLEINKAKARLVYHSGSEDKGFKKLDYKPPATLNRYTRLMRKGLNGVQPNSMRLARHRDETVSKFRDIQKIARPGISLSLKEKEVLGIKKQAISVLDAKSPSKTLTTLPDDLLHYKEPRILTVRESARIQSFPDDFVFKGKYTTGGSRRTKECPRYTQVGNAVPPLLAEVLGCLINEFREWNGKK